MNYIQVYYQSIDGAVVGWDNSSVPSVIDGCECTTIDVPDGMHVIPNAKLHRVDLITRELIDLTANERAIVNAPTTLELDLLIASELQGSDSYMMIDRPISKETRDAWIAYRQALRDLSKPQDENSRLLSPIEMLEAWPMRPDDVDAAQMLKQKVQ